MKPRYLQEENSHRDRWTISYLDVVTILLIFFVAAAAKTIAPSAVQVGQAVLPPVSSATADANPLADIERILQESGLDVHREPRGLVISLPQAILFAPGDDRIAESARPTLEQIAAILGCIPNPVVLVGHADSRPIHNRRFRNNWELSAARGVSLLELLSGTYAIEESRLSVSSEGANRPLEPNDTPDGRASNRRVEMVILANFSDPAAVDSSR